MANIPDSDQTALIEPVLLGPALFAVQTFLTYETEFVLLYSGA